MKDYYKTFVCVLFLLFMSNVTAAQPKFSIVPQVKAPLFLFANQTTTASYLVTNKTKITRTLTMVPIPGVSQDSTGCGMPFTLGPGQSCVLNLTLTGSQMGDGVNGGPVICKTIPNGQSPDPFLCSQPNPRHFLNVQIVGNDCTPDKCTSRTIRGFGGATLAVQEWGALRGNRNAQAILFIHGFPLTHEDWSSQYTDRNLTSRYRVVTLDLRGNGLSEKLVPTAGNPEYGPAEVWATDIHNIITQLGLKNVILVGHSYGALVITDYLSVFGLTNVSCVSFVGGFVPPVGDNFKYLSNAFLALAPGLTSSVMSEFVAASRAFVELSFYIISPLDVARLTAITLSAPYFVRIGWLARDLDNPNREQVLSDLFNVASPPVASMIIVGRNDEVVLPFTTNTGTPGGTLAQFHSLMPHSVFKIYNNAGHTPQIEVAERFNRDFLDFTTTRCSG